jgi:hypothetical protein
MRDVSQVFENTMQARETLSNPFESIMQACVQLGTRSITLSYPREFVPSCFRALVPSFFRAVVLSSNLPAQRQDLIFLQIGKFLVQTFYDLLHG